MRVEAEDTLHLRHPFDFDADAKVFVLRVGRRLEDLRGRRDVGPGWEESARVLVRKADDPVMGELGADHSFRQARLVGLLDHEP